MRLGLCVLTKHVLLSVIGFVSKDLGPPLTLLRCHKARLVRNLLLMMLDIFSLMIHLGSIVKYNIKINSY